MATERAVQRALTELGIAPGAAPSTLSIEQWLRLWKALGPS
jgi:hypothetical protein